DLPYLQYSWDINGVTGAAFGPNPTLTWAQLSALGIGHSGTYQVDVRVDDTFGGVTTSAAVNLQVKAISGDANFDGIVNGQDIALMASNWLQIGNPDSLAGDANGDGIVNGQDIALVASNWLQGEDNVAMVPEPSSIALDVAAGFVLALFIYKRATIPL